MKGHVGIDPDSEIITATTVTAGNAGDASAAEDLISDLLDTDDEHPDAERGAPDDADTDDGATGSGVQSGRADDAADTGGRSTADQASVYGDNAYGTGQFHDRLDHAGIESKCKTQQPTTTGGLFTEDRFDIDLDDDTVTCPAGNSAPIRRAGDGAGTASFGQACTGCPLREQCTKAAGGRSIGIGPYEQQLAQHGTGSVTRTGSRTTAPPDPKWNARSGT